MDTCKHGLMIGTCAMCAGLVKTNGELHCLWLDLCDDAFQQSQQSDKSLWFKNNKGKLVQQFYDKHKEKPPYPKYPDG